jgi:hypothetical protein
MVMMAPAPSGDFMPVTAKLSRKFYEKLGDEVTNELVEWFNLVDATYRSDLRELNELNFSRFDAKLEQRVAELDAKIEQRVAQLDAKIERLVAGLRVEMQAGFTTADARLDQRLAELETRLTKRMFGFWIAQAATTAGLVFGVVKLVAG